MARRLFARRILCVVGLFLVFLATRARGSSWSPLAQGERAVLENFYRSTDGDHWIDRGGWLEEESPCDWRGVFCQQSPGGQSFVWGISLPFNGLRGDLPGSVASLKGLRILDVAGNELTGKVPERLLSLWDRHEFEFSGGGNCFSNFVARVRIEYSASGALCAEEEDARFTLEATSEGDAVFRSVRCVPDTDRDTHCLVRVGWAPPLDRLSRALSKLGFDDLQPSYDFPFTAATHAVYLTTTVWWGDGSSRAVQTYAAQGPIEVWMAQEILMALLPECRWEREYFEPRCERDAAAGGVGMPSKTP